MSFDNGAKIKYYFIHPLKVKQASTFFTKKTHSRSSPKTPRRWPISCLQKHDKYYPFEKRDW